MGAAFKTMKVDGSIPRHDVRIKFREAQERDRHENGHSYSGGFGMASGLTFPIKAFDAQEDAEDWLAETAQKWEDALCVTFKAEDGQIHWLIGAWCAS